MTDLKWTLLVKVRGAWRYRYYYASRSAALCGAAKWVHTAEATLIWSEDGAEGR